MNMSYCMCHNTLQSLRQVYEEMYDKDIKELSEDEQIAFKNLVELCHQFSISYFDEIKNS